MSTLPTQYQQFIHLSRYARWLPDLGRRETWEETVDRYVSNVLVALPEGVREECRQAILAQDVMPSMRAMWSAGPAMSKCNVAAYNCSYVRLDSPRAFDEALYISMCGTGVGFSVERQYVNKLPDVPEELHPTDTVIRVHDSRIGWAKAFRELIALLYAGHVPSWDVSGVRPAGAVLHTSGGRSSGPGVLVDLFKFTVATFRGACGRKLCSVECHDIMTKVASVVVVGGVRRSAMISLSNPSDDRMRFAKSGQWWVENSQRALANNSAAYTERPSFEVFMREWLALHESKSGERGIFNRKATQRKAESIGREARDFGTNPCFAAGTLVHTDIGLLKIEDLVGHSVNVWDGSRFVACDNFRVTGRNQEVSRITLHDGSEIVATPYHTFVLYGGSRVQLRDLREGDRLAITQAPVVESGMRAKGAYLKGFLLGDGTSISGRPLLMLYRTKYMCEERLLRSACEIPVGDVNTNAIVDSMFSSESCGRKSMSGLSARKADLFAWTTEYRQGLPSDVYQWDLQSKAEFMAGLMDADGTVTDSATNGFSYQLTACSKKLLSDVQMLLKSMGVHSTLRESKFRRTASMPDGRGGSSEYMCRSTHRLTIGQTGAIKLAAMCKFSRLTDFSGRKCKYALNPRFNKVVSIESAGVADRVYCCTVDSHTFAIGNGVDVGNCGEISLRSCQFCNLTEVVLRPTDTVSTIRNKVRLATILGTVQSGFTKFRYLRPNWKQNSEEEALLGVSLTGICDIDPDLLQPEMLSELHDIARATNKKWSHTLGVSPSAAITCIKPSGTVSQLVDSASGLHPRFSSYYIRRVRNSKQDPISQLMVDAGVPHETDVMNPQAWVFSFPQRAPKGAVVQDDVDASYMCELWKKMATSWAEHSVSATVQYKDEEFLGLGQWVWDNFDEITGLSFLPRAEHTYQQAPYEECDEATYLELCDKMPDIDWSRLGEYESEDRTQGRQEAACVGGACEV